MVSPSAFEKPIGNAEIELAQDDALQIDHVFDLLDRRYHHAGEFDFAHAQGAALAGRAQPAQEEAEHLPQRIEPEAARHDGIALEMAGGRTRGPA